ncbi:YlxR family protein [Mycolicibacterium tokaiense]|uniref:YlxR family protein n=1 Tax=Mycolicibacterium tokaiense TaxID=39695 RepID=UPI001E3B3D2D|nr:YlxR family protein [Mycolicibacterium tokaiense]
MAGFRTNDTGTDVPAVIVDTAGNLPGRGAWLHPDLQCVEAAIRRRAFVRALRISGPLDTSAVAEHVSARSPGQENR